MPLYDTFLKSELVEFLETADRQIDLAIDILEVIQYGENPYASWYQIQAEQGLEEIRSEYKTKK